MGCYSSSGGGYVDSFFSSSLYTIHHPAAELSVSRWVPFAHDWVYYIHHSSPRRGNYRKLFLTLRHRAQIKKRRRRRKNRGRVCGQYIYIYEPPLFFSSAIVTCRTEYNGWRDDGSLFCCVWLRRTSSSLHMATFFIDEAPHFSIFSNKRARAIYNEGEKTVGRDDGR